MRGDSLDSTLSTIALGSTNHTWGFYIGVTRLVCDGELVESVRREAVEGQYIDWLEHQVPRHLVSITDLKQGQYPVVDMLRRIM